MMALKCDSYLVLPSCVCHANNDNIDYADSNLGLETDVLILCIWRVLTKTGTICYLLILYMPFWFWIGQVRSGAGGLPGVQHPCPFWRPQSPKFLPVRACWGASCWVMVERQSVYEENAVYAFITAHCRYSEWHLGQICDSSKPGPNMDSVCHQQGGS